MAGGGKGIPSVLAPNQSLPNRAIASSLGLDDFGQRIAHADERRLSIHETWFQDVHRLVLNSVSSVECLRNKAIRLLVNSAMMRGNSAGDLIDASV